MLKVFIPVLLVAVSVSATFWSQPSSLRAHEDREIGEFEVKVGFLNEPPY